MDSFEVTITDAKGRTLAEANPLQSDLGLMQFTMVLRWDLILPPQIHQEETKMSCSKAGKLLSNC